MKCRSAEMKTLKIYVFYYKVGVLLRAGSPLMSEQTWRQTPVSRK